MKLFFKVNVIIFFLFTALFILNIQVKAATIKGHVYDNTTHKIVAGASVTISETHITVVTDSLGSYIFQDIKQGSYNISASAYDYETSKQQQIIISTSDNILINDFYIKPKKNISLKEIEVKSNRNKETDESARNDEKKAPNVINIISSKTIETLPDLNVADIMQRVSGVSMLKNSSGSNSQMIIRGMPSRYNSTLVDGIAMPSTSTSDKSVSLDMFGSDLVGRIEVVKSLTPDLEGDAIGGTVNIKMKEAPDTSFLKIQLSTGYNQYFFNHDFLTFNSKTVAPLDFNEKYGENYIPKLSDFPRQNLIIKNENALPNLNGGLMYSHRFLKNKLGFMIAASAQNTYMASTDNLNTYSPKYQSK